MKKTLLLLTFIAVAGMSGTSAQAATHYVSGFGGISWMQNMKFGEDYTYARASDNYAMENDLGSGLALTGAVGCDFGNYRLEAEVGYQTNDVNSGTDGSVGETPNLYRSDAAGTLSPNWPMRGDISVLSLMGNAYYDFDLGHKVELYATGGIGIAQVSFHNVNDTGSWVGTSAPFTFEANNDPGFNAHETTLAWQVGAGIAAPIADHVKLDLRYRYFATSDFTIPSSNSSDFYPYSSNLAMNTSVSSHSVLLGLRVDF